MSFNRTPVQISGTQKVCVLVHHSTGRILCFCLDDQFVSHFTDAGYIKKEIKHASDYDMWARRLREQAKVENDAEDQAYLERENEVRQRLRKDLRDRIPMLSGHQRASVDSALHCLDLMEDRRRRYREESYMVMEAHEEGKDNVGEEIVNKAMKGSVK